MTSLHVYGATGGTSEALVIKIKKIRKWFINWCEFFVCLFFRYNFVIFTLLYKSALLQYFVWLRRRTFISCITDTIYFDLVYFKAERVLSFFREWLWRQFYFRFIVIFFLNLKQELSTISRMFYLLFNVWNS